MIGKSFFFHKLTLNLFKLLITVIGITYILHKVPLGETLSKWTEKTLPWLILILFLTIILMVIQANRWRGLLLDKGKNVHFRTFYAYIALGYFFNNLLPSGFGGDAVKTIAFGRKFGNTANSVAAIVISRIMGLLAMFICFFVALPVVAIHYAIPSSYTFTVSAVALLSIVIIVGGLFSDKIKIPKAITNKFPFFIKLQNAFAIYRTNKKAFLLSGLDSIWIQIITIIIHYAYFKAVGVEIDIFVITVFTTIMVTFTMLPISINGIGIRENVQISLYTGLLGIPAETVLASTLLSYIPLLFQASQGAIFFAFSKISKKNVP